MCCPTSKPAVCATGRGVICGPSCLGPVMGCGPGWLASPTRMPCKRQWLRQRQADPLGELNPNEETEDREGWRSPSNAVSALLQASAPGGDVLGSSDHVDPRLMQGTWVCSPERQRSKARVGEEDDRYATEKSLQALLPVLASVGDLLRSFDQNDPRSEQGT